MRYRGALIVWLCMALPGLLYSAGRTEEDDFQRVTGTNNWEHEIDVSDLDPGTYNIIVRARDEAGNEAIGGPYNVFVDPDSGLPTVTILYPQPQQRAGRELFVVGTASDNDGIARVEVRLNEGRWQAADGQAFWSASLPLANLADGPQLVSARATDTTGRVGPEKTVVFRLDNNPPEITFESHESGTFVSRRITLEGTVSDANGVASLRLNAGDRSGLLPLRGRGDAPASFSFQIDPSALEQGPHVWWLDATDTSGLTSSTPFLFFVDTDPPELEIIHPGPEDRVDAQLRFVGRAEDAVGIASLEYELSTGQTGSIPIVPGNPYWTLAVDLPPQTRGTVTATFSLTDVAGNERRERLRLAIDQDGDKPVVTLASPADGSIVERPVLTGHVRDDDGVAEVIYTVNGGPELRTPARTAFFLPLDDLGPGRHEVRIRAIDRYGLSGDEVRTRFQVATPLPQISLTRVLRAETDEPYAPGFTVAARERVSVTGTVTGPAVSRVTYRVGPDTGQAAVGPEGAFTIPLPRTDVAAATTLHVWYENEVGATTGHAGLYLQLAAPEEGTDRARTDLLPPGVYAVAPDDQPVGGTTDGPLMIDLPVGQTYRFFVAGGTASNVRIVPEAGFLRTSAGGSAITIEAIADGGIESAVVEATVGGRTVRSAPFSLRTSSRQPQISPIEDVAGSVHAEAPRVSARVTDPVGIEAVRARIVPAGPDTPLPAWSAAEADGDTYRATPALPATDGPALLEVAATNRAGTETVVAIPIRVDRTAPRIRLLVPATGDVVNGMITFAALVDEPWRAASIEATGPREDESQSPSVDRLISLDLTVDDAANELRLVTTTHAGVREETVAEFRTDDAADRPRVLLQVPPDGASIANRLNLSGVVFDDDAVAAITYSINDRPAQRVETDGLFDVIVPIRDLDDGAHVVEVIGYDIGGAASEPQRRTFNISRSDPVSELTHPSIDAFLRGVVTLRGTSSDPNGIASISVSTDSGASYARADGLETWEYDLDTSLLDDGTHSLLIRAIDGAGDVGLLATIINVDNTPPVLELASPADGDRVSETLLVDGRAEDLHLEAIRVVAQPLGTSVAPVELAVFDSPGPFAFAVEPGDLEPGWYNLRVDASDRAGNTTHVSRNIRIEPEAALDAPRIVLPASGASLAHAFDVIVSSPPALGRLTLLVDDRPVGLIDVDAHGRGSMRIERDTVPSGRLNFTVRSEAQGTIPAQVSPVRIVDFAADGAWLTVDGPGFLSFVRDRPYLTGRSGYELPLPEGDSREISRERSRILAEHAVQRVEVSMDNGETWQRARGTAEWRYRIQTTELPDGRLNMIVRAVFANGETVTRRHAVIIDEQPPQVRLLEPHERDRFSNTLRVVGVTTDENGLADVAVALRPGDKARYAVPSFIQGLYVDVHALGATYFDLGAGLTFFDNNVRIQAQAGIAPPGRFSGLVLGTKLLANVASLPASFLLGPDFDWLSAALAVGANFSYFTMSGDSIGFTEDGLVLAGMVGQLQLPIVTVPTLAFFNTYAFYTEAQLWFVSSDVEAGTEFRLSFGIRADVF